MTTDKERAETWRRIADCYESIGEDPAKVDDARRRADALDPPKPNWPDGTYAAVTCANDFVTLSYFARRFAGEWVTADGRCVYQDVTKVEPLRVLADDEIALPRELFERFSVGSTPREVSENYRAAGEKFAAAAMLAYADALDAEAGEQS